MKLTGTFVFLGIDTFNGSKDPNKTYKNAVLLQGTDTLKVFLNDDSEKAFFGVQPMERIDCELDVRFGQKTYISVSSVKKVNVKVA